MKQNNLVNVLLPRAIPATLTYKLPDNISAELGSYVEVPLGSKKIFGVIWEENIQVATDAKIKEIISASPCPPMHGSNRKFIDWVADYTLSIPGNVLKMALSATDALQGAKKEKYYRLADYKNLKLTTQRQKVVDLLTKQSPLTSADIREKTGVSTAIIKGLLDQKAIEQIMLEPKKQPQTLSAMDVELSKEQKCAADYLIEKIRENKYSTSVIDGVTGSGKTEVYFAACEEILKQNNTQVLIMLPEIALTNQVVNRFKKRFGFEPTKWHSGLSPKQRADNWRDIANGDSRLIIGARSSLFLPFKHLKLIIIDEEHDASYKQEEGVIYHARDMAVVKANIEHIPVIMASATPSIETIENINNGKYHRLHLPSRHGGATMPNIKLVDMRKEKLKAGYWLSGLLKQQIADNMASGNQSLMFLNRRGYAPLNLCRNCGYRFSCPDCSSWLVEHKSHNKLICHHCDYSTPKPKECPECEKEDTLVSCGPGVERIAEEVENSFPEAKISLMTSDKMTSQTKTNQMLSEIIDGEVDIIVGTQVISKGHHFPKLTLVGVIDADLGMEGGDLRASERTYQLLQQVSGRAGREQEQGTVILQSYMPENNLMKSLAFGNRDEFTALEIESRKRTRMPPFSKLAALIISGHREIEVTRFARHLVKIAPMSDQINVMGPVPAPMYLLRGQYRYRILLRCSRNINIQKWIASLLGASKVPSSIKIKVDIDPYSFM